MLSRNAYVQHRTQMSLNSMNMIVEGEIKHQSDSLIDSISTHLVIWMTPV
jgi:hypothetical protein